MHYLCDKSPWGSYHKLSKVNWQTCLEKQVEIGKTTLKMLAAKIHNAIKQWHNDVKLFMLV